MRPRRRLAVILGGVGVALGAAAGCKDRAAPRGAPPAGAPAAAPDASGPLWTVAIADLDEVVDAFAVGGGVLVEAGDALIAVRDGAVRWRAATRPTERVLAISAACVITAGLDALRCLDAATGAITWSLPRAGDGPRWLAAAPRGDGLLLIGTRGARAELALDRCATSPACLTAAAALPAGAAVVDDDGMTHSLLALGDDRWAWLTDGELTLFAGAGGAPSATLALPAGPGLVTDGAVGADGTLIAGWGAHVHRIAPAACAGASTIAAAAAGCVTVIADRGEETADGYAPLVLADGALAFTDDGAVQLWRGGVRSWSTDVGAATPLLDGGDVLLVATAGEQDAAPELVALARADGLVVRRTALAPQPSTGLLDVPLVAADDAHVYLVVEHVVTALRR